MITTRQHGVIDWAVAALLGGASASRSLSPPVRTVLAGAAAYHASYSAMTDYEAGLRPWLTMRQHLALDAVGGAALCTAGLMMRRQRPDQRALLAAIGLSELAVAACSSSSTRPAAGPELATYPPLDVPKRVAEDVFIVDSTLPGLMGKALAARMTVIRLANGDLLLHSPVRFTTQLKNRLQSIGRIAHLVAPSFAHWSFLRDWQLACPDAATWAAPGLRDRAQVRRSGVRLDYDLGETAPALWGNTLRLVMVPGGFGWHEAVLFHQPSATMVLTDLVVNLESAKLPAMVRPIMRLFGSSAPAGMAPPYLRAVVKVRRKSAALAAARLIGLAPQRVVFAHGKWFDSNGTALLRRSLRWLLQ